MVQHGHQLGDDDAAVVVQQLGLQQVGLSLLAHQIEQVEQAFQVFHPIRHWLEADAALRLLPLVLGAGVVQQIGGQAQDEFFAIG